MCPGITQPFPCYGVKLEYKGSKGRERLSFKKGIPRDLDVFSNLGRTGFRSEIFNLIDKKGKMFDPCKFCKYNKYLQVLKAIAIVVLSTNVFCKKALKRISIG